MTYSTDNHIKNHWNSTLRKRAAAAADGASFQDDVSVSVFSIKAPNLVQESDTAVAKTKRTYVRRRTSSVSKKAAPATASDEEYQPTRSLWALFFV